MTGKEWLCPDREVVDFSNLAEQQQDDELLIVLCPDGGRQEPGWMQQLLETAVPSLLAHDIHYMTAAAGFAGGEGSKPWVLVRWDQAGTHMLERRWLLGRLAVRLRDTFRVGKLAVALPAGCTAGEIAMAEDLFHRQVDGLYEQAEHERFRILLEKAGSLPEEDADNRFRFLSHYRRWINEEPDEMTSLAMGKRLEVFAGVTGCEFQQLTEKELREEGMNLLLAVGQASRISPSRLFVLKKNVKPGDRPLMLVGKGITFDTGGINIKPFEGFVNCMKNDMGGAALMAALFMGLVRSGYAGPLCLVIPACENLVDGAAMKPGSVIRSRSGRDVFIEHTDAEGRLILADAISYGSDHLNPALTIVAATLTTAALRQFSGYYTPVHFAPDGFQQKLAAAGNRWGERFTFWPEFIPFAVANKGRSGDLTNRGTLKASATGSAGSSVAAHFLKTFTELPMIHIDIFASCWNWSGDYPGAAWGATGAPFNSLFDVLKEGVI